MRSPIAAERDRERAEGRVRGPLHGIPVLVKDNIDTADRMMTTAGSLALEYAPPPARDAFLVARLREAGAVLLGKTNLSEWANFRSSRSTSGWSGRGGQTRHPYVLDRNPCGSSSGSGAAAAASLATLTIGTETDGSIVCPSSICGLVGVKPTVGLVSRSGIVPISSSQDTAGPMTRTVRDAALLLNAIAGADPRDAATSTRRGKLVDYAAALDPRALDGKRIGVARKLAGFNDRVDAAFARALDVLKKHGAVLVDPADIPETPGLGDAEFEVMLFEFKAGLAAYFAAAQRPERPRDAEGRHRVQPEGEGARAALLRSGASSRSHSSAGRSRHRSTWRRGASAGRDHARSASTRRARSTVSMPSSPPPPARRGSRTCSTATTTPAVPLRRCRPCPATPT